MAPELLLHGHASRASDVYAFGILMVCLLNDCRDVCWTCWVYHCVQLLQISVYATLFLVSSAKLPSMTAVCVCVCVCVICCLSCAVGDGHRDARIFK